MEKEYRKFDITLKGQSNRNIWYVDSGFLTLMTRDKNKFISLKKRRMEQCLLEMTGLQMSYDQVWSHLESRIH